MTTALVLTHVPFEDAGSLGDELLARGLRVEVADACTVDFATLDTLSPALLVVLGGPVGVYQGASYPFLQSELSLLGERIERRLPTLGICLGAQLMAAALGAPVYPGRRGKEIGWSTLTAGRDAADCPAISELLSPPVSVLHWHGDTFDLPREAQHLAASAQYPSQAWSLGARVLGLQFHPEVKADALERWYVGHASELSSAHIDIPRLREAGRQFAPALYGAARRFFGRWLDGALAN